MKSLFMTLQKLYQSVGARFACLAALLLVALGAVLLSDARGQDRNFAGSVQGSYLYIHDKKPRDIALDGFVTEASLKIAVDFSDHISTNVKVCFGCHGFEVGMAYIDLTIVDEARFRVGRFSPSFGDFQLRHDPANHRTVDKPLPYDMGRMVRLREWNEGIMPAPYVDNGVEFGGPTTRPTRWAAFAATTTAWTSTGSSSARPATTTSTTTRDRRSVVACLARSISRTTT
jgi:hypothetical protein